MIYSVGGAFQLLCQKVDQILGESHVFKNFNVILLFGHFSLLASVTSLARLHLCVLHQQSVFCLTDLLLCVFKVDVSSPGQRRVGYVANLHTQAYQDRDPIIYEVGMVS